MKPYRVQTTDYDRDLHRTVIVDTADFNTKNEAIAYALAYKPTTDSHTRVTGRFGYDLIMTISCGEIKHYNN